MSTIGKNPFSFLTNEYVQQAMITSGIDPELEGIASEVIKKAGLIYENKPSWIYYHDNSKDIPVSLEHPDICFSQIFDENVLGKDAPRLLSLVVSGLVECTKLKKSRDLSLKEQNFVKEVTAVADEVFECITKNTSLQEDFECIKYPPIEFKEIDFPHLDSIKHQIPSTYHLKIHKDSGNLIGSPWVSVCEKMPQIDPVYEFMKDGLEEDAWMQITFPSAKAFPIQIATKQELANLDVKALMTRIQSIEAPCVRIFKLPLRGNPQFEEVMVASLSPEAINNVRNQLGLETMTKPYDIPFAYLPAYDMPKIIALDEYMNIPGLEKYKKIVEAQILKMSQK